MDKWRTTAICHVVSAVSVLLIGTVPLAAQGDVFSSTSEPDPRGCQGAKNAEAQRYADVMNELEKKEADIRNQYDHERAACQGQSACIDAAQQRYGERIRLLNLERDDESTRHRKLNVDVEHRPECMDRFGPFRTPCDRAKGIEGRQYALNMAELQKKEYDIVGQYQHEMSPCRDSACRDNGQRNYGNRIAQLNLERGGENTHGATQCSSPSSLPTSPPTAKNLANKWIQTDKRPVKLGDLLSPKGKSLFNAIYQDGENPGQVIKISKPPAPKIENPAETFPRQKAGADLLQKHGIPHQKSMACKREVPASPQSCGSKKPIRSGPEESQPAGPHGP